MNKNYFEVLEECYLDVMSDIYIGKVTIEDDETFNQKCVAWMNDKYGMQELERLKQTVQKHEMLKPLLYSEILENQIEFHQKEFIPKTLDLRQRLQGSLKKEVKETLQELKSAYLIEYKRALHKRREIELEHSTDEKASKEKEFDLLESLGGISPRIELINRSNEALYNQLVEIGSLINKLPDEYEAEYKKIAKERYKISLGNMANIMITTMSKKPKADGEILNIVELLLIE